MQQQGVCLVGYDPKSPLWIMTSEEKSTENDRKIKSTAVVKYAAVSTPAKYAELESNTDLKLPPANWLREVQGSQGLTGQTSAGAGNPVVFSSFNMGHKFPDCVGEVDVVTDAENIKKLLKIPYSKAQVSMIVHRVGNTIFLDDFDVHRYLLMSAEKEWEWLRKFYTEHVMQSLGVKEKAFVRKNRSRYNLQHKSMFSKFLYYSLADGDEESTVPEKSSSSPLPVSPPRNHYPPEPPEIQEEEKQLYGERRFLRNVLWNFEDITMLIGTDMPIFGGGTRPCVSLRLRDQNKPINILTGLDYWLDNLMCNVPEVLMCYHLDGIVQKYELLKTEDIPCLDNCKFSPKVVKDIAQNILSFLKTNATKAGHTYWLFKGTDEDIVKLYDLTALCADYVVEDKEENPFSVPVAMLLYAVARNMYNSHTLTKKKRSVINILLQNCITLLNEKKHPQVVSSAHFLLAELFVPSSNTATVIEDGEEDENLVESVDVDETCENKDADDGRCGNNQLLKCSSFLDVDALCVSPKEPARDDSNTWLAETMTAGKEEAFELAVEHIVKGLTCVDYSQEIAESETRPTVGEEETQKMAKPFQPIPLKYTPLSPNASRDLSTGESCSSSLNPHKPREAKATACSRSNSKCWLSSSNKNKCPVCSIPWHISHKLHLLEKAALFLYLQADTVFKKNEFGRAFQNLFLSLSCIEAVQTLYSRFAYEFEDTQGLLQSCLGLTGDVHYMFAKLNIDWDEYRRQFETKSVLMQHLHASVRKELPETSSYESFWVVGESIESHLSLSVLCYQEALAIEHIENEDRDSLFKRLGNTLNDLAVLYMHKAETMYNIEGKVTDNIRSVCSKSTDCFRKGIESFTKVDDRANIALLNSNLGRLMRLCAHSETPQGEKGRKEFSVNERRFYQKALTCYEEALAALSTRETNPAIWDSVRWEYSTALFTMATLLQDYAPLSSRAQEDVENQVSELMNRALKYCEVNLTGPKQAICQYRAAVIHHRLASLYHHSLRNQLVQDGHKQHEYQVLADKHYNKACHFFDVVEHSTECLRVKLENVAMQEFFYQNKTGFNSRLKMLKAILDLILGTRSIVETFVSKFADESSRQTSKTSSSDKIDKKSGEESEEEIRELEEISNLLSLIVQRLQVVLLNIIKLHSSKKTPETAIQIPKAMYGLALALPLKGSELTPQRLIKVMVEISKLKSQLT